MRSVASIIETPRALAGVMDRPVAPATPFRMRQGLTFEVRPFGLMRTDEDP